MIVIRGTYTAPLEQVDAVRDEHVAWLRERIAEGRFVAAGRATPPTGSVMLLSGDDAEGGLALLEADPYVLAGVAEYRLEAVFTPGVHAEGFEPFIS